MCYCGRKRSRIIECSANNISTSVDRCWNLRSAFHYYYNIVCDIHLNNFKICDTINVFFHFDMFMPRSGIYAVVKCNLRIGLPWIRGIETATSTAILKTFKTFNITHSCQMQYKQNKNVFQDMFCLHMYNILGCKNVRYSELQVLVITLK